MGKHTHWMPSKKYELVDALQKAYPEDKSLARKPKRQLWAIWFQLWEKQGCPRCKRAL